LIPDIEAINTRAAIAEYDGGLSRAGAEDLAAKSQRAPDRDPYWHWLADYVVARKLP
jgi:hypothetical protein